MASEILLPQNVEAEAAVLGSLLIDPQAIWLVWDYLHADDFYREAHRLTFQAYCDLCDTGDVPDLIMLCDELGRTGKLEMVGGVAAVSGFANHVPASANIEHYAHIVERTAILRRLIDVAGKIATVAYNDADVETALSTADELLCGVSARHARRHGQWYYEALDAYMDDIQARIQAGTTGGILTGLPVLDTHCQGFQPGELIYVAGRPGSGKSALAITIAHTIAGALAAHGGSGMVEYVTLEMRATHQAKRLLSAVAGVDGRLLRGAFRTPDGQFAASAYDHVRHVADEERYRLARRLHLADQPISMDKLRDLLARQVNEHDCRAAFVDYLSLIEPENARADTYQRITDMSRKLKQIALELNIPIICLLQLNRETERRMNKHPMLSDLRDSGSLEQDADMVFGIYRGRYYYPRYAVTDAKGGGHFGDLMELLVLKAREGVADNLTLPLRFEGEYTRVSPWPDDWAWKPYVKMRFTDDSAEGGATA